MKIYRIYLSDGNQKILEAKNKTELLKWLIQENLSELLEEIKEIG